MIRRAIYPGSFDPITFGHLDIAERALGLFDEVILAVARNDQKKPLLSHEERIHLATEATKGIKGHERLKVIGFNSLLVDCARKQDAIALVRGLRAVSDFEYELQLALINRNLSPQLETLFLMPKENFIYLSSTIIKELARHKADISHFVTDSVATALKSKFP